MIVGGTVVAGPTFSGEWPVGLWITIGVITVVAVIIGVVVARMR